MIQNQKDAEPTLKTATPQTTLPFWQQLRWNLVLPFVLLAAAPVIIVTAIFIAQVNTQARGQMERQLGSIADLKRGQITGWLEDSQAVIRVFLADPARKNQFVALIASAAVETANQQALNDLLSNVVKAQPLLEELFVYNTKGEALASSDPTEIGKIMTAQPFFLNSLTGEYIQPPYYAVGSAQLTMLVTQPLTDQNGQIVGVLAGRLNRATLSNIMAQNRTGLGETQTGETYLVSQENNYLVTPSRFEDEGYVLTQAYHSAGIDRALKGQDGFDVYPGYRKPPVMVMGAYRWIPELQIGLVAEISEAEALATFERARNTSVVVALAAAVFAAGVGFYIASRISKPIMNLTRVATRTAAGDLNQWVNISQRNEIGVLATAFNSMTGQLSQLVGNLEEQVTARTHRLEIAASLGERLSAILQVEQLLAEIVNQVKDNFGYYHAHIYLLDSRGEKLIVAEGTGAAGAEMKAKEHSIYLNAPTSLVARAARRAEIVKVDNVRQAKDWLSNPLLPNTHSEIAVPIILEGKVVGVLDVQQDKVAGLDEADTNLLRMLANQVAVAIRNARQFTEVEAALAEAHQLQHRYITQTWDRTRLVRKNIGRVQFSLGESTTLNENVITQARQQALAHRKLTAVTFNASQPQKEGNPEEMPPHALVAPIILQDVPIGDLQFHDIDPDRRWTEGEMALINAIIDQVAQAAQTLRLLDETQERATREQLIGQISDKMRRAPDMEGLLKIAVSELSRVLGPARTFVHLGKGTTLEIPASTSSSKENGHA